MTTGQNTDIYQGYRLFAFSAGSTGHHHGHDQQRDYTERGV